MWENFKKFYFCVILMELFGGGGVKLQIFDFYG